MEEGNGKGRHPEVFFLYNVKVATRTKIYCFVCFVSAKSFMYFLETMLEYKTEEFGYSYLKML